MLVSKRAVFEICSEKKTRESITGNFKNICTVTVHCWYKQDAFAGFREQIFEKKISEGILELTKIICPA